MVTNWNVGASVGVNLNSGYGYGGGGYRGPMPPAYHGGRYAGPPRYGYGGYGGGWGGGWGGALGANVVYDSRFHGNSFRANNRHRGGDDVYNDHETDAPNHTMDGQEQRRANRIEKAEENGNYDRADRIRDKFVANDIREHDGSHMGELAVKDFAGREAALQNEINEEAAQLEKLEGRHGWRQRKHHQAKLKEDIAEKQKELADLKHEHGAHNRGVAMLRKFVDIERMPVGSDAEKEARRMALVDVRAMVETFRQPDGRIVFPNTENIQFGNGLNIHLDQRDPFASADAAMQHIAKVMREAKDAHGHAPFAHPITEQEITVMNTAINTASKQNTPTPPVPPTNTPDPALNANASAPHVIANPPLTALQDIADLAGVPRSGTPAEIMKAVDAKLKDRYAQFAKNSGELDTEKLKHFASITAPGGFGDLDALIALELTNKGIDITRAGGVAVPGVKASPAPSETQTMTGGTMLQNTPELHAYIQALGEQAGMKAGLTDAQIMAGFAQTSAHKAHFIDNAAGDNPALDTKELEYLLSLQNSKDVDAKITQAMLDKAGLQLGADGKLAPAANLNDNHSATADKPMDTPVGPSTELNTFLQHYTATVLNKPVTDPQVLNTPNEQTIKSLRASLNRTETGGLTVGDLCAFATKHKDDQNQPLMNAFGAVNEKEQLNITLQREVNFDIDKEGQLTRNGTVVAPQVSDSPAIVDAGNQHEVHDFLQEYAKAKGWNAATDKQAMGMIEMNPPDTVRATPAPTAEHPEAFKLKISAAGAGIFHQNGQLDRRELLYIANDGIEQGPALLALLAREGIVKGQDGKYTDPTPQKKATAEASQHTVTPAGSTPAGGADVAGPANNPAVPAASPAPEVQPVAIQWTGKGDQGTALMQAMLEQVGFATDKGGADDKLVDGIEKDITKGARYAAETEYGIDHNDPNRKALLMDKLKHDQAVMKAFGTVTGQDGTAMANVEAAVQNVGTHVKPPVGPVV